MRARSFSLLISLRFTITPLGIIVLLCSPRIQRGVFAGRASMMLLIRISLQKNIDICPYVHDDKAAKTYVINLRRVHVIRQELLWEAGTEREKVIQSPDTAVRERASALESRRFLKAMAEVEAEAEAERRVSNEGGDESPLDRGESQVAVTVSSSITCFGSRHKCQPRSSIFVTT